VARGRSSVTSQPQFQIRWDDVEQVAKDVVTGMTEEESAEAQRAARPMLVYIYDGNDEDAQLAVEDDRAFQTEKVAVGARFFDCLRIDKVDAVKDRALKVHARKAPCLVFVRPNFDVATVMTAKFNANRVFTAMSSTMTKDYKTSVTDVFKKQKVISRDRSKLQRDRDEMARLDAKIAETKSRKAVSRLNKKRDKLEQKVDAAETKLTELENALYTLEPKEVTTTS